MKLAMIGLGKMGLNMVRRLVKNGHELVTYDLNPAALKTAVQDGARAVNDIEELIKALPAPRAIWLMLPSGSPTEEMIDRLTPLLSKGDILIDGGNSNYRETIRRGENVRKSGIHYIDCGTSGGIWGITEGYSLMIGGDPEPVKKLTPIFQSLAPAPDKGWGHVGPGGSGHFVKMIHNGIEYGMMQAFAEGFAILAAKKEFNLNLPQISENWRYGSVVRSWLLDLTKQALTANPKLEGIAPEVADSGEGRWTVTEAVDLRVSAPVIALSLMERFRSRDRDSFADRLLAVMREQFGGHAVKHEVTCEGTRGKMTNG